MKLNNADLLLTSGWINGKEIDADGTFDVVNPATRDVIAAVADLGAEHAGNAIVAANKAFSSWKHKPLEKRIGFVMRWADLIEENADDLASIVTSENGKPLREARGEALQCAALLRWFAEAITSLQGETERSSNDEQRNYTIKQPVGVVACITPWNFPAAAVIVKAGAAILCGNTVVVKPSDETPLIALAFAKLSAAAGIPDGVFNVIPCQSPVDVGDVICGSSDVRMLSFTGSTRIGRHLYSACGNTIKRLALELGGNAPFIVFDDAELKRAVDSAVGARFYNSGQICVGANRYLVQKGIYDSFAAQLAERVRAMQPGSGFDETSNIGPMINQSAIDRLGSLVENATRSGAKALVGGGQYGDTLFFEPTVLRDMKPDMDAYRTEIFGPVACLYEFENEEEATTMANATQAGLSAYVFTADQDRLQRCTEALEAGVVGANSSMIFSNDLPFGGIKQSGLGREHGLESLDEFLETKSICMGLQ